MKDFDYENMQKKITARSASKRVGKRRGCKLPSNYLTAAQKKSMNGEVQTVQLGKKMEWREFLALDNSMKEAWLNDIIEKWDVGTATISKLFGKDKNAVPGLIIRNKPKIKKRPGRTTKEQADRFLAGFGVETTEKQEPEQEKPEKPAEPAKQSAAREDPVSSAVAWYDFEFHNVSDWTEILKFIRNMPLPTGAKVKISVEGEKGAVMV